MNFAVKLSAFLEKNTDSFAFGINLNNQLHFTRAKGWLQMAPDVVQNSPESLLTAKHRTETASCSKTITAVAMLRLLEMSGKATLDSKIGLWLPPQYPDSPWKLPLGVREITFRQLLSHTSGLPQSPKGMDTSIQVMKELIKANVSPPQPFSYSNFNYHLCRITSYFLLGGKFLWPSAWVENESALVAKFVRGSVLEPAGIKNAIWGPSNMLNMVPKAYPFPANFATIGSGPYPYENLEKQAGPASLYLSVEEYLRFLGALYSGKLLSPKMFSAMHTPTVETMNGLGIGLGVRRWPWTSFKGTTHFYSHSGDIKLVWGAEDPTGPWIRTRWICHPGKDLVFQAYVWTNCCNGLGGESGPPDEPWDLVYRMGEWWWS